MVEQFARVVELAGELNKLLDVVEPSLGCLGSAVAQHLAVAGRVEDEGELVGDGRTGLSRDVADGIGERQSPGPGFRRERRRLDGLKQWHLAPFGLLLEDGKSLWTEAARRGVDDAPERLVRLAVVGGRRKPKQGKGILNFQALIEADIADE